MGIKKRSRDRKHETNPFDWRGVVRKTLFCKERHMSVTNENFRYCANETMPLNTLRLPKFNFLIFFCFTATSSIPNIGRRAFCPQVTARGLNWNWTLANTYAVQPCPGGATGLARWK